MRLPFPRPAAAITFLLTIAATETPRAAAQAEPTPAALAQARSLFREARTLEDGGKWGEALARFERIAQVKMTPQVRFHLALCAENVGQWTKALTGYELAAKEARGVVREVEIEAGEHLHKLAEIVPRVTVAVTGAARGDALSLDHRPIPLDEPASPIAVDPGSHEVTLTRDGAVLAREAFTIGAKSTHRIELRVEDAAPSLKPVEPPPSPPPELLPPSEAPRGLVPRPPVTAPHADDTRSAGPLRIAAWSAIGLGVASGITTGVFLALRQGALHDLDAVCPAHVRCPASVQPIEMRGTLDSVMVNVFGVLTGVATAGGTALLLVSPKGLAPSAPPPRAATIHLAPALGGATGGLTGVIVGGRF